MSDLIARLTEDLEPILASPDPRKQLSAYHDMPYAMFRYDPAEEFAMRHEVRLLETRLIKDGKRITRISLAECLEQAMASTRPMETWFSTERDIGTEKVVETVGEVLAEGAPLVELIVERLPAEPDPTRDIVFIMRAGSLFPTYRTFSLPQQLMGRLIAPAILFYPGTLDGPAGLRFMGVLQPEHNYRCKIF